MQSEVIYNPKIFSLKKGIGSFNALTVYLKAGCTETLLRKEVIHPHLPVGIPCYDLILIAGVNFPRSREVRLPPTLLT